MRALKILSLAALTAIAAPAWANLTFTATGSYNLGSASSSGGTAIVPTSCGLGGQDVLDFPGAGLDNAVVHAYSCDDNQVNFGSRSSGENSFFATGTASVLGTLTTGDNGVFAFTISPGEIGAFGSTAFAAGEFQKAKLSIALMIDGKKYIDSVWSAEVGAGGVVTKSYVSNADAGVALDLDYSFNDGPGFYSYGLFGGDYAVALGDGEHNISYVMTSEASGSVLDTSVCTAYLQGNGRAAARGDGEVGVEGPPVGEAFTSYCGAGARSGDPFPPNVAIARAQDVEQLPEPMSAGLALTALLAAVGARRRSIRR